jgi:hypothetical protein
MTLTQVIGGRAGSVGLALAGWLCIAASCGEQGVGQGAGTSPPTAVPAASAPSAPQVPAAEVSQSPVAAAPALPQAAPAAAPAPAAPPVDAGAAMDPGLPPLRAEPAVLDLGVMAPRAGGKGAFKLTNVGDRPLRIGAVSPSCKCTTTSALAGTSVEPGASVSLDAELEGVAVPQMHRAAIRVAVEGFALPLELQVVGETARAIRSSPPQVNAVEGKPRQGRFVIESVDKKPFRVCSISGRIPDYIGYSPGDAPRAQYLVKYDLDTWTPTFPVALIVETDRPECPVFDVWIRHESTIPTPGYRMKEYRINAGRIDAGGSTEIVVELEDPGEELLAAESADPAVRVELVGQRPAAGGKDTLRRLTLRVMPTGPTTGAFCVPFKLYGRDKEQSLFVYGSVRPKGATDCVGCTAVQGPAPKDPPPTAARAEQPRPVRTRDAVPAQPAPAPQAAP